MVYTELRNKMNASKEGVTMIGWTVVGAVALYGIVTVARDEK